jgi:hypothetical protein
MRTTLSAAAHVGRPESLSGTEGGSAAERIPASNDSDVVNAEPATLAAGSRLHHVLRVRLLERA